MPVREAPGPVRGPLNLLTIRNGDSAIARNGIFDGVALQQPSRRDLGTCHEAEVDSEACGQQALELGGDVGAVKTRSEARTAVRGQSMLHRVAEDLTVEGAGVGFTCHVDGGRVQSGESAVRSRPSQSAVERAMTKVRGMQVSLSPCMPVLPATFL